jgi:hypothetical protein
MISIAQAFSIVIVRFLSKTNRQYINVYGRLFVMLNFEWLIFGGFGGDDRIRKTTHN